MKKLLLTIILSLISFSIWADDSGKCGKNLSWSYVDETLTISGSGEMIDFQEDGNNCPWNKYKKNISPLLDIDLRTASIYYLPIDTKLLQKEYNSKPIIYLKKN